MRAPASLGEYFRARIAVHHQTYWYALWASRDVREWVAQTIEGIAFMSAVRGQRSGVRP